jgi:hypothetical protein
MKTKELITNRSQITNIREVVPSHSMPSSCSHLGDDLDCEGRKLKQPLAIAYRAISELTPYESNARTHSKLQIRKNRRPRCR